MEWSEKRDRSLPGGCMKVSGGASCQSSAWRVRSFILRRCGWFRCCLVAAEVLERRRALWWLLGLCGPGPVFELPRLCGQHGGQEWRAWGACRGLPGCRSAARLSVLKCAAELEPNPRQVPLRNQRPPGRYGAATTRWGAAGASPSRPPRRRSAKRLSLSSPASAERQRAQRCRRGGDPSSTTAAARDRCRRDRSDTWLPA